MKVLLAIDNSEFSLKVIDEVAHRKWSDHTEFMILAVVPRCSLPGSTERFVQQRKILLQSAIANLSHRMPSHKITGEVVDGEAVEEILYCARQCKTDLIIMGAHGESGIQRRIGNVVMSVLNEAPCSVEVIRPKVETVSLSAKIETLGGASINKPAGAH